MFKINECRKIMKQCKSCGKLKLITDFSKHSGMKDGYKNQCKACRNKKGRIEYKHKKVKLYLNKIECRKFMKVCSKCKELKLMSDFYKEQRAVLKDIIINNSKISEELYDSHSKDDWWITAAQSIELGIADRFITSEEYYNL